MSAPTPLRPWLALAALVLALVPILDALSIVAEPPPQIDDAYISYRYAQNLAEGQGLVWNAGERVEGFTNPLWTLLVAFGLTLGFEATAIGYGLGLASGLALLVFTTLLARSWLDPDRQWLAVLAAGVLASFGAFAYWSTAGMETSFHAALAVGAMWAASMKKRGMTVVLLVALTWTRMDGVLLAAVLLGFDLWPRRREITAWVPGLGYSAGVGIGLALRLAYYGTWLPNTYWAKVGGTPLSFGLEYLADFAASGAALLLPAAAIAVWRLPATRPAAVYIVAHSLYVVRVGGDAFAFSRFLLVVLAPLCALAIAGVGTVSRNRPFVAWALAPTIPLAALISIFDRIPLGALLLFVPIWLAWEWSRVRPRFDAVARTVLIVALVGGASLWLFSSGGFSGIASARAESHRMRRFAEEWRYAHNMERLQFRRAKKLNQATPPDLVATGAIGSLGFHSRLPILDVLGLTDPHIARAVVTDTLRGVAMPGHARSDAAYVFSRKPDVLVIPAIDTGPIWLFALQDLWVHPALERDYTWDADLQAYRRTASD